MENHKDYDGLPRYPKRAKMARRVVESRYKSKLLSGTGNTSAQITPDGVSLVFHSIKLGHTIHWPMSDWNELKKWVDSQIGDQK